MTAPELDALRALSVQWRETADSDSRASTSIPEHINGSVSGRRHCANELDALIARLRASESKEPIVVPLDDPDVPESLVPIPSVSQRRSFEQRIRDLDTWFDHDQSMSGKTWEKGTREACERAFDAGYEASGRRAAPPELLGESVEDVARAYLEAGADSVTMLHETALSSNDQESGPSRQSEFDPACKKRDNTKWRRSH